MFKVQAILAVPAANDLKRRPAIPIEHKRSLGSSEVKPQTQSPPFHYDAFGHDLKSNFEP